MPFYEAANFCSPAVSVVEEYPALLVRLHSNYLSATHFEPNGDGKISSSIGLHKQCRQLLIDSEPVCNYGNCWKDLYR